MDKNVLKEFQEIPGVGKSIAKDFWHIGLRSISDLKNNNAEDLYWELCKYQRGPVDRCMLYVLRCAIYFASNEEHDAELLKWWNWKDKSSKIT
jgi:hypothetical protein